MKKLLLLSSVLLGAIPASQAGVSFNVGIGLPLPPLPQIVIRPPAPVVVAPAPVCAPPAPVVCAPPVVVVAPPYYGYYHYPYRYGYYVHRGWDHRWHR